MRANSGKSLRKRICEWRIEWAVRRQDRQNKQEKAGGQTEESQEQKGVREEYATSFWHNGYVAQFRNILEQILEQKHISYGDFKPVLVDKNIEYDCCFRDEAADMDEGIQVVLHEIAEDLNYFQIFTDRPEYFLQYAGTMYERNGLIVEIRKKQEMDFSRDEMILDMEEWNQREPNGWNKAGGYLPFWKKKWEALGNLDIKVPIGYNTLIVKGLEVETERDYSDKMEAEFYKII